MLTFSNWFFLYFDIFWFVLFGYFLIVCLPVTSFLWVPVYFFSLLYNKDVLFQSFYLFVWQCMIFSLGCLPMTNFPSLPDWFGVDFFLPIKAQLLVPVSISSFFILILLKFPEFSLVCLLFYQWQFFHEYLIDCLLSVSVLSKFFSPQSSSCSLLCVHLIHSSTND